MKISSSCIYGSYSPDKTEGTWLRQWYTWGKVAKLTNWSFVQFPRRRQLCYCSLLITPVSIKVTIHASHTLSKHKGASHFTLRQLAPKLASTEKRYLTKKCHSRASRWAPRTCGGVSVSGPCWVLFSAERHKEAKRRPPHVLLQAAPANYNISPEHRRPRLHANEPVTTYASNTTFDRGERGVR